MILVKVAQAAGSRARNLWFRFLGVRFDGYAWLRRISIPRQWSDIHLGDGVALDDGVALVCSGPAKAGKLTIGARTYINRYTILMATDRVKVGRNCMFGPNCYITDTDHGIEPGALIVDQPLVTRPVEIGDDVWLGANVVVLKGVTIGSGAVIGAGAVVTSDIPPNMIAVGVPARVVRSR